MMNTCGRCKNLCQDSKFRFDRPYRPDEWLEGYVSSPVWIIGLNPGMEIGWQDEKKQSVSELETFFAEHAKRETYFRQFQRVSPLLFEKLGQPGGVAHTDIVKCASKSWPPGGASGKDTEQIIDNCIGYLKEQIDRHHPKVVICNGSAVVAAIQRLLPPDKDLKDEFVTSYVASSNGQQTSVVLSGFIGRIDNFARRRLGLEIESIIAGADVDWARGEHSV